MDSLTNTICGACNTAVTAFIAGTANMDTTIDKVQFAREMAQAVCADHTCADGATCECSCTFENGADPSGAADPNPLPARI